MKVDGVLKGWGPPDSGLAHVLRYHSDNATHLTIVKS